MSKLWGGRFEKSTDAFAEGFHSSISFDKKLYAQDIAGSVAHSKMLAKQGIISGEDARLIEEGLLWILSDIESGNIEFSSHDEDIHMNIERVLTERIGEPAKRLHTARSRNDQVALDFKMYVKDQCAENIEHLKELIKALVNIAKDNTQTIMPAYTHLQKAQPTTLAHHVMAYAEMFKRDAERLADCLKRTDVCPLGSGALCATTYPLDREFVANELGFANITMNSLDGVSDRDFALEFLADAGICMMHLSRFCEELINWSTGEFGFVRMDDAYSTGSSIMPQKKNPDMAELIRGKTGRVYGDLMGLLTVMKGLPLAYNKDMQEDKEGVFDAAVTLSSCLSVFTGMVSTMTFNKQKMYDTAGKGFTNATDAADYLVKKGLPFRDAHEVLGKLVLHCEQKGIAISDIPLSTLKEFSSYFESDVAEYITLEACVNLRNVTGGPAPDQVEKHIEMMEKFLTR